MNYYIVDAFTDYVFGGNPAGVCVVDRIIESELMQKIASENNLSETAFVYRCSHGKYDLKWFTPKSEINLCGHATLATAYVISHFVDVGIELMEFNTLSGVLSVENVGDMFIMNFPAIMPKLIEIPKGVEIALGTKCLEAYLDRDLIVVVKDESVVKELRPDYAKIGEITEGLGLIVTSKGIESDFVSRCFYPKLGVNEDPVTGSAHSFLAPLWGRIIGKTKLVGYQLSERGGIIRCELHGDRVYMKGKAVLYLKGELL
ncbi:MAG: PhzF family phenazine biosynthesis protein [Firmicutes bacterium]|nr:PhzF family phenazine biosynthesis protein [Bacillota bacterium]